MDSSGSPPQPGVLPGQRRERFDYEPLFAETCPATLRSGTHPRTCLRRTAGKGVPLPVTLKNLRPLATHCDIEEKVSVTITANPQQLPRGATPDEKRTGETTTARQLLRSEEVNQLNCTVSGDALYANDENARLIAQEKGRDYLFRLKDNQPCVFAYAQIQLKGTPFLSAPRKAATAK